jgi:anti-sigma B factor antagonist
MNLKIEENGNVVLMVVKEERLDAHNSDHLKQELARLFEEGKTRIVVDLKEVRFIDSSGLGALVSGFKNASSRQAGLKLSSLQNQVKSMFELTRLQRVFDIYPTVDEAIEAF